jgi:hypothetical protein
VIILRGGCVTGWGAIWFIFPLLTIIILLYIIYYIYYFLVNREKKRKRKKESVGSVGSVGKVQNSQIIRPFTYFGKVVFLTTLPTLSLHTLHSLNSSFYTLWCSTHLPTFAYFSVFITIRNDGNTYIEYHMDFLPKTVNLQRGGYTSGIQKHAI